MTIESNYAIAIAIATLSDWLKNLAPIFQPMRTSKTKTNHTLCARFFPRFEQVTGNSRHFDWFIAPFAPIVIGRSNYSANGFSTVT